MATLVTSMAAQEDEMKQHVPRFPPVLFSLSPFLLFSFSSSLSFIFFSFFLSSFSPFLLFFFLLILFSNLFPFLLFLSFFFSSISHILFFSLSPFSLCFYFSFLLSPFLLSSGVHPFWTGKGRSIFSQLTPSRYHFFFLSKLLFSLEILSLG